MTIKSILAAVAVVAALSITLLTTTTTSFKVISAQDTTSSDNTATTATSSSITVHAGGGNSMAPLTVFVPQQIEVSAGQSVTWDNPSTVGEPHTATFILDNKTATNIVSPFAVPDPTQFTPIPSNSNSQPFPLLMLLITETVSEPIFVT
jgi:plastocyanin